MVEHKVRRLRLKNNVLEIKDLINRFESGATGEIVKTQTTYFDVVCSFEPKTFSPQKIRIHFRGKREFSLGKGKFSSFQMFDEHPLLIDYNEPIVRVHLASAVDDKQKFREELEHAANQVFDGWRSFERYLTMPLDKFLEKSYGVLVSAPKSFAEVIVKAGERCNMKFVLHEGYDRKGKWHILLLDDWYVIADSFRTELRL